MKPSQEIADVLSAHGLDAGVFENLAAHSYEHSLARAGADKLDEFYKLLFAPGLTLAEVCAKAPAWPAGKYAGKQPSDSVVSKIGKTWRAESMLDAVEEASRLVDRYEQKVAATQAKSERSIAAGLFRILADEVLTNKIAGKSVSEQLPALDRLLARDKVAAQKLTAEVSMARFQRETCEMFLQWQADQRAREIADSGGDRESQIQALGQLMFGEEWKPAA